jgi:hypothetical protein
VRRHFIVAIFLVEELRADKAVDVRRMQLKANVPQPPPMPLAVLAHPLGCW